MNIMAPVGTPVLLVSHWRRGAQFVHIFKFLGNFISKLFSENCSQEVHTRNGKHWLNLKFIQVVIQEKIEQNML